MPKEVLVNEIETVWNSTITKALEHKLTAFIGNYETSTETFVKLYCKQVETYNPSMQKCLHETAYQAMKRCYKIDVGTFNEIERKKFGILLSRLFEAEWSKVMENVCDVQSEVFLDRLLQLPPFLHFMNIFYTTQRVDLLNDTCKVNLLRVISMIETKVDKLFHGSLAVGDLKVAYKFQDIFVEAAGLAKQGERSDKKITRKMIVKALKVRMKELEAFQMDAKKMASLMFLCKRLPNVDVSAIEKELNKQAFIEKCALNDICKPVKIETVQSINTFMPSMTAFKLPESVRTIIPQLSEYQLSAVFLKMWEHACEKNADSCTSLEDVVNIWKSVSISWLDKSKLIQEGTISFRDFENLIVKTCHDDDEVIASELRNMRITEQVVQTRLNQLKKYKLHKDCRTGAKILLDLKSKLGLSGNYNELEVIAADETAQLKMEHFDDSFISTYTFLEGFSTARINCIHTFLECHTLVQWLKESMHTTGLKEFQVFVELAFIAIGDDPFNIGKVQTLHSAVNGYAPLIFDLPSRCDFEDLLDLCKIVWRNLEANSKLPKQLADTESQIEWLKEIKNAHGSVEVTCMMQTDAINSDGTIIIGRHTTRKDIKLETLDSGFLKVEDTIKLTVPGVTGIRKFREYTFAQLQDLQSRLMLVAGKAEKGIENVERFTMILDSITRLSNVFIKLYGSGCVLFKEWSVRFICDPDPTRPVCVSMEFANGSEVSQLKGRRSVNEDLKDMIPKIARFLESCLKDWLQHIEEKREIYQNLNYFTVDQLVILQKELLKFGDDEQQPSHLIYPLLSAVKEDCTEDDVIEAMKQAKELLDRKEHDIHSLNNDKNDENDAKNENELRIRFMQKLVQAGQSELLAERAFKHVDPDDYSEGILWCMGHAEDEDLDEMDESGKTKDSKFIGWSQSAVSMQSLIDKSVSAVGQYSEIGVKYLIEDLQKLWKEFLESIKSNVKDYLSIEHLGIILEQLSSNDIGIKPRVFPVGFKEGVPNLIVCPSDDVLNTTLSIYLSQNGQPLPRADEVLMCKADTTKEEVGIFFRRVFAEKGNKIHCLLNTELLPYNVSETAKRQLEEHLQQAKCGSLRLFVICESDSKHRTSTLVSFLHKYKRQPPIFDFDRLRSLMRLKLAVEKSEDSIVTPAAYADHERSSVRVIKSWRPGVGKTLFMNRKGQTLKILNSADVNTEIITIPLQEKEIDIHYVIERLFNRSIYPKELAARLFHIDISNEVQEGVDYLLFHMLILGRLTDRTGYVWTKSENDLHLIETMPLMIKVANERGDKHKCAHQMLSILPDLTCRSPEECLRAYTENKLKGEVSTKSAVNGQNVSDQLFDKEEFGNEVFQTPFQYLIRLEENKAFEDIHPDKTEGSPESCLRILLRYCGVHDPSWAELRHFVWFLNTQLNDFRANIFLGQAAADLLPGFSKFTLKFLIQMSKDFSTRSLKISEESPGLIIQTLQPIDKKIETNPGEDEDIVQLYQMRRTWESSPHPYIFFNADRMSLTFLGFNIEKRTGNLIDHQTGRILERGMMKRDLFNALVNNNVPLQENFDMLRRMEKIARLRSIMGIESNDDPDDSYELTTDNVKKMMAIYMRFMCNIPVIIMGETGCGKTRLVKFLCGLQQPADKIVSNMVLMKIHGGTTNTDIIRSVQKAETLATENQKKYGKHMYTVLFLDEANSTEAIGLIKELLCDKSIHGVSIKHLKNLKIVAACNPYRKHSEKLIKKLEQAGLGYHVDADETTDRIGRVPMRRLVYRVQPLPQSLLPLVWDFGQLNTEVEDLYIRQMVRRYVNAGSLPDIRGFQEVISDILTKSQDYMRNQKDECSFVSLRDVERTLIVMSWFYQRSQGQRTLFNLIDQKLSEQHDSTKDEDENEEDGEEEDVFHIADIKVNQPERIDDVTRSLILALGVCYHACLKTRAQYRKYIAPSFKRPCLLHEGPEQIFKEIDCCQNVFLDHVDLEKNIARNMALRENVFMMVICIELRIPLFLIGKPGSSKSLAKTIVSDAMRGNGAKTQLFREMKQAQMASFQCSPLSTPDGIVGTFRQCAQFQKDNDLNRFVSVVVLDEVGLAEDSPRMPLKTLHPLLEDGCQGEEDPEDYMKVAFIGISNWALDPAKMNRGIIVQRDVPDLEELINSARGICKTDSEGPNYIMEPLIRPLAESYLELFSIASKRMREFFGLRDFYSLIKMVFNSVEETRKIPTWFQMLHAIMRNFGGLDQVDPVEHFKQRLSEIIPVDDQPRDGDPDCSTFGLIRDCLFDINCSQSESRYLLLLTENFGALSLVQQLLQERSEDTRLITIFGSSFRSDQEYTQVCRNINKVKVCMETGNTVVLLNLENLYESLYDALNQYYVSFGDVRYVDLGLGTHRVKCPVHPDFRLIVVAEKQTVYEKFPIPLINRLEKHFLTISTMLSVENRKLVDRLKQWMEDFAIQRQQSHNDKSRTVHVQIGDVFIGYHEDTCSAVIVHLRQKLAGVDEESILKIFEEAKLMLLWCTTPDAVARLAHSVLPEEEKVKLIHNYYENQAHDSILEYLEYMLPSNRTVSLLSQVTTYSKLLSTSHIDCLSKASGFTRKRILFLETLSSFDTEQQFTNKIRLFIQSTEECSKLIVIQCDSGDINANLIACARYCVMGEYEKARKDLIKPVHFIFIVQLPKIAGGCFTAFQCGNWHSAHIDDLIPEDMNLPAFRDMYGRSVGTLFGSAMAIEDHTTKGLIKSAPAGKTMNQNDYAGSHTNDDIDNPEENPNTFLQIDESFCAENDVDLPTVQVEKCEESKRSKLDVKTLVLHCVPAALAIVKDKEEQKSRETDRVDIVLRLIHQDQGDELFIKGLCYHIAKLLHQKETESGLSYKVREWLVGEVANFENITKAGTFRNSCIKVLESKICPILAGIIAVCDTNENLSILADDKFPWKQGLWIDIFNSLNTLKFKDLPFREKSNVQSDIPVLSTSSDGHTFCVRMPFSWIFIQKMNEVLNIDLPTPEEHDLDDESMLLSFANQRVKSLRRILDDHALFKALGKLQDDVTQKATEDYLWDVINTLYPSKDDTDEFHLVFEATFTTIKRIQAKINGLSFLDIVIYIHLVVDSFLPRLRIFHSLVALWPECIEKIFNQCSEPDCDMLTGYVLTIRAASLLIETFSPKKGELDEKDDRAQWIGRYHRFRSIVEKIMAMYHQDVSVFGEDTGIIVKRMKSLWSRVMVMRLFIEHVCVEETDTRITIKFCSPLWAVLDESTDMKNINSINAVEKFLITCNKTATKVFIGSLLKCSDCEKVLEGYPVTLPCSDILCNRCYHDLIASGQNSCAKCRTEFGEKWCPKQEYTENINSDGEKMLRDYQKRCNAFFMDAISQLSFADNTAPSKEVVAKLLSYAFYRTPAQRSHTKTLSIFDTGIDPNPVFRSFLLQLLLKTSERDVIKNLEKYLGEAKDVLSDDVPEKSEMPLNLSLLIVSCVEDKLMQSYKEKSSNSSVLATKALDTALKTIESDGITVEKLYGLACARFGLRIVAESIVKYVQHNQENGNMAILQAQKAKQLCQSTKTVWPRKYLVKYLCRFYGTDVYYTVCEDSEFEWMQIANSRSEECDRFVVCGSVYVKLRDAVMQTVHDENIDILNTSVNNINEEDVHMEPLLQLGMYREITKTHLYPPTQRKTSTQMLELLANFFKDCEHCTNKELIMRLLENRLVPSSIVTRENEDFKTQGIHSLIVHFLIVIVRVPDEKNLLWPLSRLSLTPDKCADFFLPTMPQDDLEDIKNAIIASTETTKGAYKTPAYYKCPNGHPYVIGDCGQPVMKSKCQCGAEIGGENYVLVQENTKDSSKDQTMTGHILGPAENRRGQDPKPERLLTSAECATIRLMIHMAMYLGVGSDREGIENIIHPDIDSGMVEEFLWHHIQSDIGDIHRALARSVDDVLLFIHCIINEMMVKVIEGTDLQNDVYMLSTKGGRQNWEDAFTNEYLKDIFSDVDSLLQRHNNTIVNDKRLGADPLLNLLFETETTPKTALPLQEIPMVWGYRTPVTLHHLRQRFDAEVGHGATLKKFSVLQLFLKEEYHLRALRFIPSIVRLHSVLLQKYQRKLDKAEASKITIAQLKRETIAGHETETLFDDFAKAWDLCREALKFYVCKTDIGSATVLPEYSHYVINENTPVSMMLPTNDGAGLCSYALLDFLLRKQNDFLEKYFQETGSASSSVKVRPKEITSADLISYDEEHDLIPLVLANCQYTFMMGEGNKIDYDFKGLERQIMDRFLFSKSEIEISTVLQVELMTYRTESTNATIFEKLSTYIRQEELNSELKTKICSEIKCLPDICQSLYNLDIAISFLKTTGGLYEQNLHDYLTKTLQMKTTVSSQRAQQMCQLRHIKSLWLLLALLKSKTMIDNHQRREFTFENIQSTFDADLSIEEREILEQYLKPLSVEKISSLVECIHEFILLKVAVKQNVDEEDYIDITHNKLQDWLLAFIFEREDHLVDTVIFEEFPADIMLKHCAHAWVVAYEMLKGKQAVLYSNH
ncbi:E3 ubiquitin-protein ligase rnf213-alpha-like [Ruditapes philippinarum]|uniref:E3 ubiquitin-protein ligase rnf213-alpha-like n=1 Tax=Ruditapes philippinarum TaxID=129788 RepID=UPI00295BA673|nr:E3 ubiquitin-protein ligase rnf213-alpha-like [Ruditapes philippinarum]